tara:strand:- start:18408 stop:19265 length:858 start_codon:yes stop_codon:yes gene_type:complete
MSFLTVADIENILGRKQHKELLSLNGKNLNFKKILITGSGGSLGQALINRLDGFGGEILTTDIIDGFKNLDVTNEESVKNNILAFNPDLILHLAGAKHAPEGEIDTWNTFEINTIGTKYLIDYMDKKCKLVLTSTCKASNPEVVYGASKLIAERMVLNIGGSVARFFNVIETAGNVFEIWNEIPNEDPIDVASVCERHFISVEEAIGLILFTALENSGRYIVNSSALNKMNDVAERLYPNRKKNIINPRRGDRISEKFLASSENIEKYLLENTVIKVNSIHDAIL